jgi:tRNA (cytosine38-C5)-methyltransferase
MDIGYQTVEFLLSPLQYGIPNSRSRYYLLASTDPPSCWCALKKSGPSILSELPGDPPTSIVSPLYPYLDEPASISSNTTISDKILERWGTVFDIVRPSSTRSCCFTRGELILLLRLFSRSIKVKAIRD